MRRAFTLAETLITLSIIGIVTALILPHVAKSTPDEMKMRYLKAYDGLSDTVQSIISDNDIYNPIYNNNEHEIGSGRALVYYVQNYPLYNYSHPTDERYRSYSFNTKFCSLLRDIMRDRDAASSACNGARTENDNFDNNYNFETVNGMAWFVPASVATDPQPGINGSFYNAVIVDLNGVGNGKGPNAEYNVGNPQVIPDRYKFYINAKGKIFPADPYGQLYIATRRSSNRNGNAGLGNYNVIAPNGADSSKFVLPSEILVYKDTMLPVPASP